MAVVSGIVNVIGAALGWRARDVDDSLSAVTAQVGGCGWFDGWPYLRAPNLDSTNFTAGMLLGKEYLQQNRHWRSMTFVTDRAPFSAVPVATSSTAPENLIIKRVCFGCAGFSANSSVSGNIVVRVDGGVRATLPVAPMLTLNSRIEPSRAIALMSADFTVAKGQKIEVDFTGVTCAGYSFYDRHVTLLGYGENLS